MTTRDRLVVIVLAILGLIVGAWMVAVSPRREQAGALGAQVVAAQAKLDSLQGELTQREAVKQQFNQSYSELTSLGEAVPADDDVPSLLFQLQSAANATGVSFQTIAVGPASASSSSTPSAAAAPTPAGAPGATSSTGSVGSAGFSTQTFNFTFQGSFLRLGRFFDQLEHGVSIDGPLLSVSGRLITVNSITLQGGLQKINATVQATAYVVPPAQGLLDGATAAGPAQPGSVPAASTPAPGVATPTAVIVR